MAYHHVNRPQISCHSSNSSSIMMHCFDNVKHHTRTRAPNTNRCRRCPRNVCSPRSAKVKTFANWRTNHPKPTRCLCAANARVHSFLDGLGSRGASSRHHRISLERQTTTDDIARHILLGCSTWILISPIKNLQIFYNNSAGHEKMGRSSHSVYCTISKTKLVDFGWSSARSLFGCHTIILMDRHYTHTHTQTFSRRGMCGMHVW